MHTDSSESWPALELHEWMATRDTFHMWLQIIGKVRLKQAPPINHSWHTTLYVTSRGLTTSPIPHGEREFEINLDLIDHRLGIASSDRASFYLYNTLEEVEQLGVALQRSRKELRR